MKKLIIFIIALMMTTVTACATDDISSAKTEKQNIEQTVKNGLKVNGTDLVDENNNKIQLRGMSTHGIAWFPQFVNYDSFKTLRDDWNTNCIRLAMYTDEYDGYCSGGDKEKLKNIIKNGVSYATDLGMYVIIDWHVLNDQNPQKYKADAVTFFNEMSALYKDNTNVIYEICNEPNGSATWNDIKDYANSVIPVIRNNDPDAVILVGTPFWSQEIDKALADPLNFNNIMYVLHFYADTHRDELRSRLDNCVKNGLPVFISEFGMCDASGNGGNNFDEMTKWKEIIDKYNLSYICWNLSNKGETSAVIKPECQKTSQWSEDDLTEGGKWIRNCFRNSAK